MFINNIFSLQQQSFKDFFMKYSWNCSVSLIQKDKTQPLFQNAIVNFVEEKQPFQYRIMITNNESQ